MRRGDRIKWDLGRIRVPWWLSLRGGVPPTPPAPAPSCSIVLTGDASAGFPGSSVPTIDGQTFSVAPTDDPGVYLASTAIPGSVRAIPADRILWIRVPEMTAEAVTGDGLIRTGFLLFDGLGDATHVVQITKDSSGSLTLRGRVIGGSTLFNVYLASTDLHREYVGIGQGSVFSYDTVAQTGVASGAMGDFLTNNGLVSCALIGEIDLSGGGTGTYSATYVTDQSGFDVELSGGEDFCGNEI